ncbi:MAG TPA: ammonia-forming cytochrome c nitrite reductase subunit c552 [Planctomycetota bacterium]|jgi:nitrite reductase (cytochrome c-552)
MGSEAGTDTGGKRRFGAGIIIAAIIVSALTTAGITYLLVSIFQHKQEAKNPYLRFVKITDQTTDPKPWGLNWPREYNGYMKTAMATRTNFGGGDADPAQKAKMFPWLTRMFAGYAFAIDYRDRRGHAYMLFDQEHTRRITERAQPGACLNCHSSVVPTYSRLGDGNLAAGFEKLCKMSYKDAHAEVEKTGSSNPVWNGTVQEMKPEQGAHPVSCVDCHDPDTMRLRVNRPPFLAGIKALKESQGVKDYDANRDATRQEMRTFVCAQCHVEYYCGPKVPAFYPWNNGVTVDQIESYYDQYKFPDGHTFYDWVHAETGAELLKAQHPEFETWNQGVHARSGVTCADCHMPYRREGAMKVSEHWVRSPLLNVAQACQQCHPYPETELSARVKAIQDRNYSLLQRAGTALTDMLDTVALVRKPFNESNQAAAETKAKEELSKDEAYAKLPADDQQKKLEQKKKSVLDGLWAAHVQQDEQLKKLAALHRRGQWRLDYVAAENSMGFHAPQETARVLGDAIDFLRQAQLLGAKLLPAGAGYPVTTEPPKEK